MDCRLFRSARHGLATPHLDLFAHRQLLRAAPPADCRPCSRPGYGPSNSSSSSRDSKNRPTACRAAAPPSQIVKINPAVLADGGLDPANEPNRQRFAEMLQQGFLGVDLGYPGLRILNIDPPVLVVREFMPAELCDAMVAAASASGKMQASKVGGLGNLTEDIRTSRTLPITSEVLARSPQLSAALDAWLAAAGRLFQLSGDGDGGGGSSVLRKSLFSKPSGPGQLAPELPQVAHYAVAQHFLAHEDAFPPPVALQKGYQRRATLLVYLNDVAQGGATTFNHLGISVRPEKGKALVFFPAFSGGMPDARTLHAAEDAVDGHEKWVSQLWICSGLTPRGAGPPAPSSSASVSNSSSSQRPAAAPAPTPSLTAAALMGKGGGGGKRPGSKKAKGGKR